MKARPVPQLHHVFPKRISALAPSTPPQPEYYRIVCYIAPEQGRPLEIEVALGEALESHVPRQAACPASHSLIVQFID
jgi:hypothetical protein